MRRIAVVGGGVAGLTAAWALRRDAAVTLYEADSRLGGHAHSHSIARDDGGRDIVDTGFIVMNYSTYPTLVRLFDELGVRTQPAEMSMSVSCTGCGLEYAGAKGLAGLTASRSARRNPRYWRLLAEVPRFHRAARAQLNPGSDPAGTEETFRQFLERGRFSEYFVNHFAIPLVACVWSCPPANALDYPARYLFSFLSNHGMLRISGSPKWQTVVGGSQAYVARIASELAEVRLGAEVTGLTRQVDGVVVQDSAGAAENYDAAVLATHPDQALRVLNTPTGLERDVLGAFSYSANQVTLHNDSSLLPSSTGASASWNYRTSGCEPNQPDPVLVTYDMNLLQQIRSPNRHLVSLNAAGAVKPGAVVSQMSYSHPVYNRRTLAAQRRLPHLNSPRLAFAGAYHGWGFHEDGARSGAAAARALGARW